MNPDELLPQSAVFGTDVWWIVAIKVLGLFVVLLVFTIFNVWFERRVVGKMQQRKGPIMNGPLGLGQALADGTKALLKEDFRPTGADKVVFNLAPLLMGTAAFTAWSVMPIGGEVTIFGEVTRLQLTDLPMGVLFILSIASIGIYGVVLAGWASTSQYAIVGSIRSTAQMVSYEIAMGLSLVAVFMYAGSMSTSGIVDKQMETWGALPQLEFPSWFGILLFPSFIIYVISMVAETNRAPFDLVECEQELVSGYLTDYSGFRYAIYFLAEYINMATVSGVATTLFLGGYHAPWPLVPWVSDHMGWAWIDSGWMGPVWFFGKVLAFIFFFVWLRGTLPRLRYDQFMHLGWKWLIPINLVWILLVAVAPFISSRILTVGWFSQELMIGITVALLVLLVVVLLWPDKKSKVRSEVSRVPEIKTGVYDPFEYGYPVPPMPGQTLAESSDILVSASTTPTKPAMQVQESQEVE
ncbi:MAG: NADH-quinone oxidoreductase subunit NuoH [Propionibacteriaceae bacterium]|nr:NADH-quinone oxidoreductase subunit NuoH [Propionibacteriaceae bacterium]